MAIHRFSDAERATNAQRAAGSPPPRTIPDPGPAYEFKTVALDMRASIWGQKAPGAKKLRAILEDGWEIVDQQKGWSTTTYTFRRPR